MAHKTILILDFGGRNNQLIARRIRDCKVYCEVLPYSAAADKIRACQPVGVVLVGGKAGDKRMCDPAVFSLGVPMLGIGYGAALLAERFGGQYEPVSPLRDVVTADCCAQSRLLDETGQSDVLLYCAERITALPDGFVVTAKADGFPVAAFEDAERGLYGVQFSPEYPQTTAGGAVLHRFLYDVCGCAGDWDMACFAEDAIASIRRTVGEGKVLLALSGGVDSSCCAALLAKAIGPQLICIFVDTGLMRKNEGDEVMAAFADQNIQLIRVDAEARFLAKLAGVDDPERKRKIIGEEFIRVFEEEGRKIGRVDFLGQGTIYPDLIESGVGDAGMVKSHHNVGGLPSVIDFKELIEPLRHLFKDEVRALGRVLGLPEYLVKRQPFPGPGLGVRCIGECTKEKLDLLREVDFIYRDEIAKAGLDGAISQYFAVLTPMRSTGVKGDERIYGYTVALRAVRTSDFMTAEWVQVPYETLGAASERITREVKQVNRVVYDITGKPPATIEWE